MKIWTKEIKLALVAIVAVVCVYIGINFLKGVNIFEAKNTYFVKFKDVCGLTVNNAVYVNGYAVGIVRAIDYNYSDNGGVVVSVELDKQMRIPRGTTAELDKALLGGVTMNLLLGENPADNLTPRDTIFGQPHVGALDKAGAMIPDVQKMLPKLDSILYNVNTLLSNPALMTTLQNVSALSENLRQSTDALNKMMAQQVPGILTSFDGTAQNLNAFTGNLKNVDMGATMDQVNGTVAELNTTIAQLQTTLNTLHTQLNSTDGTVGALLNDKGLYDNINRTVQSADSLMTDLKAHPKRYVHFSIFGKKDK